MGRSSVRASLSGVRADGVPVYRYDERPGLPPVSLTLMEPGAEPDVAGRGRRHAHDFHVLVYAERGRGSARAGDRELTLSPGSLHAVPPGVVVDAGEVHDLSGRAWSVAFTPDAVPGLASAPPLAWEHHPLLALFAGGGSSVVVPETARRRWEDRLRDLGEELADPTRPGAAEAVGALLTSILVDSARRAEHRPAPLDPLVARVFAAIEGRFHQPVTVAGIAGDLGFTAGHLTTVLRERTGRTLGAWIVERRLLEVRRLLRETDLPLGVIAARTGLGDAGYLIRRFRRRYGLTPERWRRGLRGVG